MAQKLKNIVVILIVAISISFARLLKKSDVLLKNKAGYTATPVACGWAGAVIEVTRSFGREQ